MNRKCFCYFNNINTNGKDDDLFNDWIEFRFEKLETNLTDEDKIMILFAKRFLILFQIKILIMFLIFWMILGKSY